MQFPVPHLGAILDEDLLNSGAMSVFPSALTIAVQSCLTPLDSLVKPSLPFSALRIAVQAGLRSLAE